SLDVNAYGNNSKCYILLIITNAFSYEEIKESLKKQIQQFLTNKMNIKMSLYKTDLATNKPVYYLKDFKNMLWKWFYEEYLDNIKHSSFYTHLQEN
ncbi:14051_t:CDS:2, partial [Cetraspora pellucida]